MSHLTRVCLFGLLGFASACTPAKKTSSSSVVRIQYASLNQNTRGIADSVGKEGFSLSEDYCYALHVTGDNSALRRLPPSAKKCGSGTTGLGLVDGLHRKGSTVELEVPAGPARRFDLLAFPRIPSSSDCSATLTIEPSSVTEGDLVAFLNGVRTDLRPRLIATGTADLKAGDNVVTLTALSSSNAGVNFACSEGPKVSFASQTFPTIVSGNASNYTLSGECTEEGGTVTVTGGNTALTSLITPQTATCTANHWQTEVSFSAISDGPITLTARHQDASSNIATPATLSLTKDSNVYLTFADTPQTSVVAGAQFPSTPNLISVVTRDATGTPVTTASGNITLSAYTSSDCSGTPLTPVPATTPSFASLSSGQATYSAFSYTVAGNIYFKATLSGGTAVAACSSAVTITADTPAQLAFLQFPPPAETEVAGSPFTTTIMVKILDAYGNLNDSVAKNVTLSTYTDSGCSTPSLGSPSGANASSMNGISTFSSLAHQVAEVVYIKAQASSVTSVCTPTTITISTGALNHFAIQLPGQTFSPGTLVTGTPSDNYANIPFSATVYPVDAYNNWISNLNTGSIQLSSTDPNFITPSPQAISSGTAVFSSLKNSKTTSYTYIAAALVSGGPSPTMSGGYKVLPTCSSPSPDPASAPFHTGQGTVGNPYLVCTTAELGQIGSNLSSHFLLGTDLDLASFPNWTPLGNGGSPFTGSFKGNGYSIRNLNINSASAEMGFFGAIDAATIQDVWLEGVSVSGGNYVGALAGSASNSSTIQDVGVVLNSGNGIGGTNYVGGLLGTCNSSTVSRAYLVGQGSSLINGSTIGAYVGGLLGDAGFSTISASGADVHVRGGNGVGGVIGYVHGANSTIQQIYDPGTQLIEGNNNVGGVIGSLDGGSSILVEDLYSLAPVARISGSSGSGYLGGLLGDFNTISGTTPTLRRAYSASAVSANSQASTYLGGLFGQVNSGDGCTQNCYWSITNASPSAGGGSPNSSNLVSYSTLSQLKSSSNLTSLDFTAGTGAWTIAPANVDFARLQPERNVLMGGNTLNAHVTLEQDHLRVTKPDPGGGPYYSAIVYSTTTKSAGKWYWEVYVRSGLDIALGVSQGYSGGDENSGPGYISYTWAYRDTGMIHNTSNQTYSLATWGAGDTIGVALDLDSTPRTVQFYKNGALVSGAFFNNLTSGAYTAIIGTHSNIGYFDLSVNFGTRPFYNNQPPPSGYLPFNYLGN
ncbi:MAG: hypothetical protein JST16_12515 [Bdellovibrionales bacterium]|nr:hypothetical protein [Bdellovibrionales bacterium]